MPISAWHSVDALRLEFVVAAALICSHSLNPCLSRLDDFPSVESRMCSFPFGVSIGLGLHFTVPSTPNVDSSTQHGLCSLLDQIESATPCKGLHLRCFPFDL